MFDNNLGPEDFNEWAKYLRFKVCTACKPYFIRLRLGDWVFYRQFKIFTSLLLVSGVARPSAAVLETAEVVDLSGLL